MEKINWWSTILVNEIKECLSRTRLLVIYIFDSIWKTSDWRTSNSQLVWINAKNCTERMSVGWEAQIFRRPKLVWQKVILYSRCGRFFSTDVAISHVSQFPATLFFGLPAAAFDMRLLRVEFYVARQHMTTTGSRMTLLGDYQPRLVTV